MAWNEPGGNGGDKDPWGGRKGEQGPPDLDEVVKKFQEKVTGLFGGRGGGGRGGRMAGAGGSFGISLVLIILVAVWALSGIYIVDEGRRGVVLQFGAFNKITDPGPHWYPRFIQSVEIVDVQRVRSVNLGLTVDEGLMLTQDENIVDVKFTVQYAVKDPKDFIFNVRNPDATLRQATESAMREVVGKSGMDFVITEGRSEVAVRAQKLTQDILDGYKAGIVVTNLNMQDAKAPEQVQAAFDDAIKAREDKERQENEAEAYANDILPKARGQAARITQEAEAYREEVIARAEGQTARFTKILREYERAPQVTRKRLYLEAMESVLANSSKVMVDVEGSNNLMYLPLDRVIPPLPPFDTTAPGGQTETTPSREPSTSSRPR
ncbi:MAG: FtsH protease activity modulator HflK, partial [Pseudomonadota bacterium]